VLGNWPCGQDAGQSPQTAESAYGADEEVEPRQTAFDCGARRVTRVRTSAADSLPAMLTTLVEAIDRRLASLLLARARRKSPLLKLFPESWIRPRLTDATTRLRRSLALGTLCLLVAAAATILWLTLR
jgi:hypothetical protein